MCVIFTQIAHPRNQDQILLLPNYLVPDTLYLVVSGFPDLTHLKFFGCEKKPMHCGGEGESF